MTIRCSSSINRRAVTVHPKPMLFPTRAVMCWFGNVVRDRTVDVVPVHNVPFEHGDHAICVIEHKGHEVALVSPGVGAPAAVTSLEIVISLGSTLIIGCGGAGIVRSGFDVGHVIVPTGAIRDEGTSYHYAPADVAVLPHPRALAAIDDVLTEAGVPHDRGLTWTTDAIFRETPAKVALRREQGCITVEMEAASMFAPLRFAASSMLLLYAATTSAPPSGTIAIGRSRPLPVTSSWTWLSTPSSASRFRHAPI
jgi:nucleoside phosphorylase